MKKTLIVISFFVIAACFEGTSSKAYTSLPYWYTDATTLSKFESVNVTYQKQRYSGCNMTLSKLSSFFNYGMNAWDDELDLNFSYSSTPDVVLSCISRATAENRNYEPTWVGVGGTGPKTLSDIYYKPNSSVLIGFYTHSTAYAILIWDEVPNDGTYQTSTYYDSWWEAIAAHEIGHASGFSGHDVMDVDSLMSPAMNFPTPTSLPQYYDKKQMELIYN